MKPVVSSKRRTAGRGSVQDDNEKLRAAAISAQAALGRGMRSVAEPYPMGVGGVRIQVFPHVFPPKSDTALLIRTARIRRGERVLEPFAGTGAISIALAAKASAVVATDINPDAVESIKRNAELNGLMGKVKAVNADIFRETRSCLTSS